MLIIFGIKRLVRRLATVFALCSQCGSPAAQVIVRTSTWFSLFFIPVVPLGSRYSSTCTFCGVATRLDKEQALHTVELAQHTSNQALNQAGPPPPSTPAVAPPPPPARPSTP
jgi:zinc-ribbon family